MLRRLTLTALLALAAPACAAPAHAPYTRNVAIVVYQNAEPLDWTGPYEVYHDAAMFGAANGADAFNVYIVSKTKATVDAQGLPVAPTYSIADAPKPDIVVFPGGPSSNITDDAEVFAWAKKVSKDAEIAQSVCTGAFVLGKAGLLDGLTVTTFHGAIDGLQKATPKARVESGRRFVDNGHVVTTAGISAGIDGSLHVVARLLGRRVADQVATYMEYSWVPEPTLARGYPYLNPSADERGRQAQAADMQLDDKRYADAAASYRALATGHDDDHDAWYGLGQSLANLDRHAEAGEAFAKAAATAPAMHAGYVWVGAAREYALAKRDDDAITALGHAASAGYPGLGSALDQPEFAALRSDPRVGRLVAKR